MPIEMPLGRLTPALGRCREYGCRFPLDRRPLEEPRVHGPPEAHRIREGEVAKVLAPHLPDLFAEHRSVVQPVSIGVDDGVGKARADLLGPRMLLATQWASLGGQPSRRR